MVYTYNQSLHLHWLLRRYLVRLRILRCVFLNTEYIQFANGVDPFRVNALCDMLYDATRLFDEEVWTENRGMLESMPPYCSACDIFGHSAANCKHYRGHART